MSPALRAVIEQELLTVQEVCALTGIRRGTLLQHYRRGKVDAVKKGSVLLFAREDFRQDNSPELL